MSQRTGPTYDKWVGKTPCKRVLSYNETNLTWQPKKHTWYWASSPPNNGYKFHKSLTKHSLLNGSTTKRQIYFEVSLRLAIIRITSLALPQGGGKCQMGYSG
jgi:hypothetical protein